MRYAKLFLIFTLLISSYIGFSQTTTVTLYYTGAQAWGCCSVCGTDYMCIGSSGCGCCQPAQQTKTFMDSFHDGEEAAMKSQMMQKLNNECRSGDEQACTNLREMLKK